MLSNQQINQFQLLWKNRFGEEISREEAYEEGTKLVQLLKLVYKPMTENEYKQLQKRREEIKKL